MSDWNVFRLLSVLLTLSIISSSSSFKLYTDMVTKNELFETENSGLNGYSSLERKSETWVETRKQYVQIAVTKDIFYYTPLQKREEGVLRSEPSYLSYQHDEVGRKSIILREEPKFSPYPGKTKYVLLKRNLRHKSRYDVTHYVYDVLASKYKGILDQSSGEYLGLPYTRVTIVKESFHSRKKRSKIYDRLKETGRRLKDHVDRMTGRVSEKKVIHIPTLFVDEEKDGFQYVFYDEMISAALCLTTQPELNRHELVDEYEVLLCNKKGYGPAIWKRDGQARRRRDLNLMAVVPKSRKRREDQADSVDYQYHDPDSTNWHMDKNKFDVLWKVEHNGTTTTTTSPFDYDYEYDISEDPEGNSTHPVGWESDDAVSDPTALDYMTWPPFLQEGQADEDSIRLKYHSHNENLTLLGVTEKLGLIQPETPPLDRKEFALNESSYLVDYYERFLKLGPYNLKPLIVNFFDKRERTLSGFRGGPITLERLRQLFILFTIDVHHVNCFNRHVRYYGYIMKKPASVNGDEITNGARLTRGIIMRALELLRHVPQYNFHKELFLRFLIASLKERASFSKSLVTLIGESDYSELYEVAVYLENLLQNGIHPDEKDQDLFVQETRFYSHHFMNTLTL